MTNVAESRRDAHRRYIIVHTSYTHRLRKGIHCRIRRNSRGGPCCFQREYCGEFGTEKSRPGHNSRSLSTLQIMYPHRHCIVAHRQTLHAVPRRSIARDPSHMPPSVAALNGRNEIPVGAGPQGIFKHWTLQGLQILELLAIINDSLSIFHSERSSCEASALMSCGTDNLSSAADGCADLTMPQATTGLVVS